MAGWFYLGGGREGSSSSNKQEDDQQKKDNSNNGTLPYTYRQGTDEIYNKGFEIWPQYYQQHHHQHQQNLGAYSTSFGAGPSASRRSSFSDDPYASRSSGGGGFSMRQAGVGGGGGMNCQDCGNQAKKDCSHMRCRTCCKSRGFQCQTHVKSTWVPAAKRRERQQQQHQEDHHQPFRGETSKRLRELGRASTSSLPGPTATTTRLATTAASGLEVGHFPPQVNTSAVFRCVRVSSMEDPDEQLAYQAAVHIGGHLFKGILYDYGPESRYASSGGENSSAGPQQLNLITGAVTAVTAAMTNAVTTGGGSSVAVSGGTSGALIDPSSLYQAPFYIAGTQFFPPPRS